MSQTYIDEVRALHNAVCIVHDSELMRVVGIHFDAMDAYYVARAKTTYGRDPEDRMMTMVGGCDSLEGRMDRYEHIERGFHMNGSPRTETFAVTADTRRQFGLMMGDDGLAHYDEDIRPLLLANGGTPDEGGEDPAAEVRAAFALTHPAHADAIAGLNWMGLREGVHRFQHHQIGHGLDFDHVTGATRGDVAEGESDDVDAVMAHLASISTSEPGGDDSGYGRLLAALTEATGSRTRRASVWIGGRDGGNWDIALGGHVNADGAIQLGLGFTVRLDGTLSGRPDETVEWRGGHTMPDGARTERFLIGGAAATIEWQGRRP